ncbi:MAG TPA: hypothetical protein DCL00_04225, partial [Opitutae bacterium]|nr:hypothetical protein [Opitutae bacterium]
MYVKNDAIAIEGIEKRDQSNFIMKFSPTVLIILWFLCSSQIQAKRLFLLSGQSNMQGHRPAEEFTPLIEKAYGKENV